MSGVLKGIGKVFKAVGNVVSGVFHAVKKVAVSLWHIPIIRYAAIAVAAYFTAGAAMAYFGSAGAAGGTAGAFAAGSSAEGALSGTAAFVGGTGATAATTAGAGLASDLAATAAGAGFGGAAAASGAAFAGGLSATEGALAAGMGSAGAFAAGGEASDALAAASQASGQFAAFSGQAAGQAAAASGLGGSAQASATAATSTGNFGTSVSQQAAQNASTDFAQSGGAMGEQGSAFGQQASNDVSGFYGNSGTAALPATSDTAASGSSGLLSPSSTFTGPGAITQTGGLPDTATGSAANDAAGGNIITRTLHGVGNVADKLWQGFNTAEPSTKLALLSTALQVGSALLAKPQPQMQFAGVNDKGYGPGTLIHTTNNGFGLGVGGGQQAPTAVPSALQAPGPAPAGPQLAGTQGVATAPKLPGLTSAPTVAPAPAG